ncbi:MAG: T9SS type A sorting domain-containing protein [Saprospiraceae bacterium]|uniref:T9SS type A sorting domain-containing protein n=1 Tax=Candidatus Opimibacter skivensis TaxID=2982028 RepID=A0A9D7SV40_9BACT|nr:T9SS type A sorting domain-containing protein [Candidatus Opimibacter skivensis]
MNTRYTKPKFAAFIALCFICIGYSLTAHSQTPLVTVRFANPAYTTATNQYCVDVEFKADTTDLQVFGMNVRFFYDDDVLEFAGFSDFKGGYDAVTPNPPYIVTSSAGPALFNFTGPADFVNGAIQLVNMDSTPIILDTILWTKIYQICFVVDDPNPNVLSFCPSLIWDMEQDPENGGYLNGDDGVVITCIDPDPLLESQISTENVVQFNWMYTGSGTAPFGEPIENACIPLTPPLVITAPLNMSMEMGESTNPSNTGVATASDLCEGNPAIFFGDSMILSQCSGYYEIVREWTATNECNQPVTCYQLIYIHDTTPPILSGIPQDTEIICDQLPAVPVINADDISQPVIITYSQSIEGGSGYGEYDVKRQWVCTDGCGNSSIANQYILWKPNAVLSCEIELPHSIECNSDKVLITSNVTGQLEGLIYSWEVSSGKSYIQDGDGTPQIYIHTGEEETTITLTLTDLHGCITTTSITFDCTYHEYNGERLFAGIHVNNDSQTGTGIGNVSTPSFIDQSSLTDLTDLNMWPNPANESLNLGFESTGNHKIQIAIVNFLGQINWNEIINTHKGYNEQNIDISQMAEGNYLIRVKSDEVTYSKVIAILHQR